MSGLKRERILGYILLGALLTGGFGCSTLPQEHHRVYRFPRKYALIKGVPARPYIKVGVVRAKADYASIDPDANDKALCENYFNKAVRELVLYAHRAHADAVIDVRSVAFMLDGTHEEYPRAECTDDGAGGEVLVQGTAIKFVSAAEAEASRAKEAARAKAQEAAAAAAAARAHPAPAPTLKARPKHERWHMPIPPPGWKPDDEDVPTAPAPTPVSAPVAVPAAPAAQPAAVPTPDPAAGPSFPPVEFSPIPAGMEIPK